MSAEATLNFVEYASPNREARTLPVRFIILHGTWMASDREALARLCDPESKVSCHYFIDQQGALYRLVEEDYVAWHAGQSVWEDIQSLNGHSIGIEISHPGPSDPRPYHEAQYQTLEILLEDICQRYSIKPECVLGHSDIAPGRKDDPGPFLDWQRLVDKGLAKRPVQG